MITVDDLKAAIAECQGERNPNAQTCMKLAAYYTILRELEPEMSMYSYTPAPIAVKETVDYYSETEFGREIDGKDMATVVKLLDELMTTLSAIQPRLYEGVMRRLRDI